MKLLAATLLSLGAASSADAQGVTITRQGARTSQKAPAENFTGSVSVERLFEATEKSTATGASVTFEPGARTAWHSHPAGQVLIVTAGVGRVQGWGGPVEEIRPGDVVRIPPGQKHWHGASRNASMTHIAIVSEVAGKTTDWMEKVSDAEYGAHASGASGGPTPAQRLIGDFSPKLVELTDEVLFGDVWARPQLSPRDRSLVTVSALIAMNRPDQLRSHLARARENGVMKDELVETITHLAFYAGWPSAISAVTVAKDVLQDK